MARLEGLHRVLGLRAEDPVHADVGTARVQQPRSGGRGSRCPPRLTAATEGSDLGASGLLFDGGESRQAPQTNNPWPAGPKSGAHILVRPTAVASFDARRMSRCAMSGTRRSSRRTVAAPLKTAALDRARGCLHRVDFRVLGPLEVRDASACSRWAGRSGALAALPLLGQNSARAGQPSGGRERGARDAPRWPRPAPVAESAHAYAGAERWLEPRYMLHVQPGARPRPLPTASWRRHAPSRPRPRSACAKRSRSGAAPALADLEATPTPRRRAPGRGCASPRWRSESRPTSPRPPGRPGARAGGAHRRASLPRAPGGPARARPLPTGASRAPSSLRPSAPLFWSRSSAASRARLREQHARILRQAPSTAEPPLAEAVRAAAHPRETRRTVTACRRRSSPDTPTWRRDARRCGGSRGGRRPNDRAPRRHAGVDGVRERRFGVFGAPQAHEDDALRAVGAELRAVEQGRGHSRRYCDRRGSHRLAAGPRRRARLGRAARACRTPAGSPVAGRRRRLASDLGSSDTQRQATGRAAGIGSRIGRDGAADPPPPDTPPRPS